LAAQAIRVEQAVTGIILDPDDGRDIGLRLPRHRFADFRSDLPPPPDMTGFDNVIRQAYLDYHRKVVERAEELAGYGFGLGVEYGAVSDPDDPAKVTFRGTYRIVPLHREGQEG
jgi:hypothetical protein